jgi:N-acyl-D-amino-acid deacylase
MVGQPSVEIAKALGVPPPAQANHILRYMAGRRLDFAPGQRFAYSNFGYCVLGRVMEKISRQSYETYVRENVLAPMGIRRMQIGKTLPAGRAAGEVRYYDEHRRTGPAVIGEEIGKPVPLPYGAWHLEAMDAHGGWIASAIDLVRFASAFDKPAKCNILNEKSITTMFARPAGDAGYEPDGQPKPAHYGCGWSVVEHGNKGGANQWHLGGLDGTAAILVRRGDGLNWAALFNAGGTFDGTNLGGAIDSFVHIAADKVKQWPKGDLFEKLL